MEENKTHSYFVKLLNFFFDDRFGSFDVNKVLSHLIQLGSLHKELQE